MATKPTLNATGSTAAEVVDYSPEAWDELEKKRAQMKEARKRELFDQLSKNREEGQQIEEKFVDAVGDAAKADEELVLLSAYTAGKNGVALSDLRRLIPDPNHLNKARESLLKPLDRNSKGLPARIVEKRGTNNEMRIYVVEQEQEVAEP